MLERTTNIQIWKYETLKIQITHSLNSESLLIRCKLSALFTWQNLLTLPVVTNRTLGMGYCVGGSVAEWFRARAGVVIRRSRVQGLHPATSGICFSVVPSSNPRSRSVNSQLVCLLPFGIFNSATFILNICFPCFSGMPVS